MEENIDKIIETIDNLISAFGDKKYIQTKDVMRFYSILENDLDADLDEVENILINKMKETTENKEMLLDLCNKLNKMKGE